jgi:hypothetical protein
MVYTTSTLTWHLDDSVLSCTTYKLALGVESTPDGFEDAEDELL